MGRGKELDPFAKIDKERALKKIAKRLRTMLPNHDETDLMFQAAMIYCEIHDCYVKDRFLNRDGREFNPKRLSHMKQRKRKEPGKQSLDYIEKTKPKQKTWMDEMKDYQT